MLYRLGWKFGYSLSKLMQAPRKNRIKAESDRIERLAVGMLLDKNKVPENITSLPDQMKEQCGGAAWGMLQEMMPPLPAHLQPHKEFLDKYVAWAGRCAIYALLSEAPRRDVSFREFYMALEPGILVESVRKAGVAGLKIGIDRLAKRSFKA
ncbi:hypothetical protein [Hyphomicrobium sp. NDB2Meth4]|uniref:hypothetical protein n=1 Tax=Hyphomicrobium sp. NDB2Meth4 TaxID=1892846 RepID=UPI000A76B716|nr:hypothetical protein [Hyphomicrobium sp. NDB2Meth4]